MNDITVRTDIRADDAQAVRDIVASTGFFYQDEIAVAVELVEERLSKGEASGYHFIFGEITGQTVGYTCFGSTPCTLASWDLYWIAVHHDFRGYGIGKKLLAASEEAIRKAGGKRIYIETASRELYAPTRAFYLACGYIMEAMLKDFYAPGDSKCIFVKELV